MRLSRDTKWRIVAVCVFCVAVLCISKIWMPLRFGREDIKIHVQKNRIIVDGLYEYKYSGAEPALAILYAPFPVTDGMEFPEVINIEEAGERGPFLPIHYERVGNRILFPLDCRPAKATYVRLRYQQKFSGKSFTYILTTTKTWAKPIREARFEISGLPDQGAGTINYPFTNSKNAFRAAFQNFYPSTDLRVIVEKEP